VALRQGGARECGCPGKGKGCWQDAQLHLCERFVLQTLSFVDQNTWETKFTTSEGVASLGWYQRGEILWKWGVVWHDGGLGSVPREDWMSCYSVLVLWTGELNCKSGLLDKCQGLLHWKMMYAAC